MLKYKIAWQQKLIPKLNFTMNIVSGAAQYMTMSASIAGADMDVDVSSTSCGSSGPGSNSNLCEEPVDLLMEDGVEDERISYLSTKVFENDMVRVLP